MDIVTVDMKELSPEIHAALQHVRDAAYADGEIPGKHKLLVALAIAASVKCEPCVRMYAEKAAKVDYKSGDVQVEYGPNRTTPEKIVVAFNQANRGFRAELPKPKPRKG